AVEARGELRWGLRRGVPAIAERHDTPKGARAVPADPDWRMRLLDRLGGEADVVESIELACEAWVVGRPQLLEDAEDLVGLPPGYRPVAVRGKITWSLTQSEAIWRCSASRQKVSSASRVATGPCVGRWQPMSIQASESPRRASRQSTGTKMQWRGLPSSALERCPFPHVSSTRITSPAPIRRVSPSLAVICTPASRLMVHCR